MEDGRPDGDPGHEPRVEGHIMPFDDIEDGIIEKGNQPRNTNHSQRLRPNGTENNTSQGRRKEGLIDAIEAAGATVHVEDEGEGGQDVDEVDADGAGESPVVEGVGDVAAVVGEASFDVVVHAQTGAEGAVSPPADLVVEGVRVRGSRSGSGSGSGGHDDDDGDITGGLCVYNIIYRKRNRNRNRKKKGEGRK